MYIKYEKSTQIFAINTIKFFWSVNDLSKSQTRFYTIYMLYMLIKYIIIIIIFIKF